MKLGVSKCKCDTELLAYKNADGTFDLKCIECGFEAKGVKLLFPIQIPDSVLVVGKEREE